MGEHTDPETGEIIRTPLSVDEARDLIYRTHGVTVDKDDPMMWLVTLHGAMIEDYKDMLARHEGEIKTILFGASEACVKVVNEHLDRLGSKAITANIEHSLALVEQQSKTVQALETRLMDHRRFVIGATLVTALPFLTVLFLLLIK